MKHNIGKIAAPSVGSQDLEYEIISLASEICSSRVFTNSENYFKLLFFHKHVEKKQYYFSDVITASCSQLSLVDDMICKVNNNKVLPKSLYP